ncbi:hypothetical protein [Formosa sp. S-31]|uniref:hypothetical protein n=1 Tax=Formosa sp. S-31 TaxID=2790949 RepID=UPI003EBB1EA2
MKKNNVLFSLILALIFLGCSSDSDSEDSKNSNEMNFKFITYMSDGDDEYADTMIFKYDNSGNIESVFQDVNFMVQLNNINKIESMYFDGYSQTQEYSNNKLVKVIYSEDLSPNYLTGMFNYTNDGLVKDYIEEFGEGYEYNAGYERSAYFTYDSNGTLLTSRNEDNTGVLSYEFDDKINPFYPLWKSFGYYMDPEIGIYDVTFTFFEHNPTKIFKNGELYFEASYTYDSDGYPKTCNYKRYNSSGDVYQDKTIQFVY